MERNTALGGNLGSIAVEDELIYPTPELEDPAQVVPALELLVVHQHQLEHWHRSVLQGPSVLRSFYDR